MKKIRYSLIYNRKKKLNQDGEALIRIKAYLKGKSKYLSTKIYVKPHQWDDKQKKVKKHPNQFPLNKTINDQLIELEEYELKLNSKQDGFVSLDQLENYQSETEYGSYTQFFMIEMRNEQVSKGTLKAYVTTYHKLKHFKKRIYFEELTFDLIRKFDAWLRETGLKQNTIAKHHKNVKKFINLAIRMNLLDYGSNPYRKFKIRREATERTFLTEEEIGMLEDLKFFGTDNFLEPIRDMFLFSCYTGLRYSDVSRLSLKHLTNTKKGYSLKMTAKKTGKKINLPLYSLFKVKDSNLSKPEALIERQIEYYELTLGKNTSFDEFPIFGESSEQHVNRSLKVISKMAGIDSSKSVSTHIARHSFGTAMATKVKLPILQKLMQHSSLRETQIYLHMSGQVIENELEKVNWG